MKEESIALRWEEPLKWKQVATPIKMDIFPLVFFFIYFCVGTHLISQSAQLQFFHFLPLCSVSQRMPISPNLCHRPIGCDKAQSQLPTKFKKRKSQKLLFSPFGFALFLTQAVAGTLSSLDASFRAGQRWWNVTGKSLEQGPNPAMRKRRVFFDCCLSGSFAPASSTLLALMPALHFWPLFIIFLYSREILKFAKANVLMLL